MRQVEITEVALTGGTVRVTGTVDGVKVGAIASEEYLRQLPTDEARQLFLAERLCRETACGEALALSKLVGKVSVG